MSDAAQLLAALRGRGETLATAESLTGGLIGAQLTAVPGASEAYLGGVVSYATRLKAELAGVNPATLAAVGPVAERTAIEMAVGVARRCGADWGLAVTGVAGPTAQDGHPVGQLFVAVSYRGVGWAEEHRLAGDRDDIRQRSAQLALASALSAVSPNRSDGGGLAWSDPPGLA